MARARCPSRPMFDSRLMVDTSAVVIMVIMLADQAEYLLKGREMISRWKSHFQPRMIFSSVSPASACSFFYAAIVSRGIGSSSSRGRAQVWMARRGAHSACSRLSKLGRSIMRPINVDVDNEFFPGCKGYVVWEEGRWGDEVLVG